ncbi:hypothetical protein C0585_02020 [Candidatus Woesearchaeota archaeon]|nr:MAG: hypothetical protein C0585_02020 [Candidatus Woesearchaeota archaeon]
MTDKPRPKKHHKDTEIGNHHDGHYHFLEGLEEEDYKEKKIRFWIPIMGIILVLLAFTFLLPLDRIGSIVESKKIDSSYLIDLDNGKKILFDQEIYEVLRDNFISSNTEFKVCLKGEKTGSTYHVEDLYYPRIIEATYNHVTSEFCDRDTLISMHSHPSTFCIFSRQDIYSYTLLSKLNPDSFIGLICDIDRFNFYGY